MTLLLVLRTSYSWYRIPIAHLFAVIIIIIRISLVNDYLPKGKAGHYF